MKLVAFVTIGLLAAAPAWAQAKVVPPPQASATDAMAMLRADFQHMVEDINRVLADQGQKLKDITDERDRLQAELKGEHPAPPARGTPGGEVRPKGK